MVIVAFDALDHVLVDKFMMDGLKQAQNGVIDLTQHYRGGGLLDTITDEVFATFITGMVPDEHGVKLPIDMGFTLSGNHPTIFNLTDSVAVDVPSWNRNHQHFLFQNRVGWYLGKEKHREAINMDSKEYWGKVENEKNTLVPDLYNYIEEEKLERIKEALQQNKSLTMIYFWFTDIQGHVQKHPPKSMYDTALMLFRLIKSYGGDDTLYIIMSDHGMIEGHHRTEGFWSLSKPLLEDNGYIDMTEWYSKIQEWLEL